MKMIVPPRNMAPIEAPALVRTADISVGTVIMYAGRPLRVAKVCGSDPAAPVIMEELVSWGDCLAGQFALWSVDGVLRAMANISTRKRA